MTAYNDALQKLASPLLYSLGRFQRRWSAPELAGRAVVLIYHRIAPPGGRGEEHLFGVEKGVPVDVFEAQMRFMCRHFSPARAADLVPGPSGARDDGGPLRFAVTFDDGYEDNLTVAAPVLRGLGIPATLYATTDWIGTDRLLWWEQLADLIRATGADELPVEEAAPGLRNRWPMPEALALTDAARRERAHWLVSMALMRTPPADIEGVLERLAERLEVPLRKTGRETPLLDWDGVRELQRQGWDIGAHGATHANLGLASEAEVEREVMDSVERVKAETGATPETFAYAYGGPEHRGAAALRVVERSGCRAAFTTDPGTVGPESSPFELPRVGLTRAAAFACAYKIGRAFRASAT